MVYWAEVGAYVVGNVGGCNGMLGSPILEGSNWRKPGVPGVEGVDNSILWRFAAS
jgi:hypothetical protein